MAGAVLLVFIVPVAILWISSSEKIKRARAAGLSRFYTGSTLGEIAGEALTAGAWFRRLLKWLLIATIALFTVLAVAKGVWWLLANMWNLI